MVHWSQKKGGCYTRSTYRLVYMLYKVEVSFAWRVCYHNETLYVYASGYEKSKFYLKLDSPRQLPGSLITKKGDVMQGFPTDWS